MARDLREELRAVRTFDDLMGFLRDEMDWPIEQGPLEDDDEFFFEYSAEELGLDASTAARIEWIKRLRPLSANQPWGIFFIKFEPKRLPVVALRRILSSVVSRKRASANAAQRQVWQVDDLLFISNYGTGDERQISFAQFSQSERAGDLPTLKVLGWDNLDTALHLDTVADTLVTRLAWPADGETVDQWRSRWRSAFRLRPREAITTSKQLSIRLAELARAIRDRIKTALAVETESGPLTKLMKAFQEALVHDLDADGFADMYAQTIAYGLLSARIADPHKKTADDFAGHMRTNPFLRELMETFLTVGGRRGKAGGPGIDFDELGVSEVVELLDDANMEAVVRDFGDKNPQEDPVIHFYELFLKEYDAKKRMQRGVFYTPRPVVSYIVRSVDELLRTEFGLADGLADVATWGEMTKRNEGLSIPEGLSPDQDFVQILDPATGTGTFLVEVIDLIHKTLVAKWKALGHDEKKREALWNEYVPRHLLTRLHGYELLMAPYAIAHLKIGLKLYETGYRFGSDERARIYLTNALEPASGLGQLAISGMLPALAHEAEDANEVKRGRRFTVVIGNPPYSKLSINSGKWIDGLLHGRDPERRQSADYYSVDGAPMGERTVWLQDDYIKFIRLSHWLLERAGVGIHAYISNNGYLDNPTLRGMRHQLTESFAMLYLLDLHGSTKRGETGPGPTGDQNVFDIQQGVGIGVFVKNGKCDESVVRHSELWGNRSDKYAALASQCGSDVMWETVDCRTPFYLFVPTDSTHEAEYRSGVRITEIFNVYHTGIITKRDSLTVHWTPEDVLETVADFSALSPDEAREQYGLPEDVRDWRIEWAQEDLRRVGIVRERVIPILYRPCDIRYTYFTGHTRGFLGWPVADVTRMMMSGKNLALVTTRMTKGEPFGHVLACRQMAEVICLSSKTSNNGFICPLYADPVGVEETLLGPSATAEPVLRQANFQDAFCRTVARRFHLRYLERGRGDLQRTVGPEDLFCYVLAILHSPEYRRRYRESLSRDFPRIPLPGELPLFCGLVGLGSKVLSAHLLQPLRVDKRGATSYFGPGDRVVRRVGWSDNTVWIDASATKRGEPTKPGTMGFRGVREAVWKFRIGGYQVCEKWLKDRKGRTLSEDDIAHYQKIVVALSETIRLMKEIDEVIEQHGGWPGAFQTGEAEAALAKVIPFRPRTVEPKPEERYTTCVPLVPLKAAAGAFSDPQHIEDEAFEWVAVESRHRLRKGMFVARVIGKSMEPAIPDGAYCLFRAPVEGTRQGKTVLVQLRDTADPETGQRYTVKRYDSEKAASGDVWRHERIILKPMNPDFKPIVLTGMDEGELAVIAELVEVLGQTP